MSRKTERFVDVLHEVDIITDLMDGGWDISTEGVVTFHIPPIDIRPQLAKTLKCIQDWDAENIEIKYDVYARSEDDLLLFEGQFEVTYDEKDEQGE